MASEDLTTVKGQVIKHSGIVPQEMQVPGLVRDGFGNARYGNCDPNDYPGKSTCRMLTAEQSPEVCRLESPHLRLVFLYVDDRWNHELAVRSPAGWHLLLSSVEGDADQPVLPGPAFQDVRLERLDDRTAEIQAFGQAGGGVYSAAIRFDAAAEAVDFDIAARANRSGALLCLASRYVVPRDLAGGLSPAILNGASGVRLVVQAAGPLNLAGIAVAPAQFESPQATGGIIDIGLRVPKLSVVAEMPRNARWQYRFAVEGLP
ncbi:MAG: hypothetical protein EXS05_10915 [Planctomycetaceae bacterium]|nr:hypothetical protein [Planctomycetaceae bacterium]